MQECLLDFSGISLLESNQTASGSHEIEHNCAEGANCIELELRNYIKEIFYTCPIYSGGPLMSTSR